MEQLLYPDATQWVDAAEAGHRAGMIDRRQTAMTDAGGLMASGDYKGAAARLYKDGAVGEGSAVAQAGYTQETEAAKLATKTAVQQHLANGDFAGAYQAAGTDAELLGDLDKIAAHMKQTTSDVAAALQGLKDPQTGQWLPPELARPKYAEIKAGLSARGIDAKQLDGFDPTPANLDAIQGQVLGLEKQLEMHKPVTVGTDLVDPVTHQAVYKGPKYEKVGPDETLLDIGGGGAPGPQMTTPQGPAATGGAQPRGLRNNNPLNVSALPHGQWDGQTGVDGQYATFATPEAGLAAADKNLQSYATHHGINTLAGIITRWSPPTENDTKGYIATVSKDLGVDPTQPLNMADPTVRSAILHSMAKVEIGQSIPAASAQPSPQATGDHAQPSNGPRVIFKGAPKDDGSVPLTDSARKLLAGKFIQTGVVPPFGQGPKGSIERDKFYNEAAAQADDLHLSAADLVSGAATTKALGASLTQMQKSLEATQSYEQTALANGDLMMKLAPKGAGQTNIPVVNRWLQAGRKQIAGDPDVTAFDNAIGAYSEEYAKVMTGNLGNVAATDGARKDAAERLGKYAAQGQLAKGYEVMKQEMENRNHAQEAQVEGIQKKLRSGSYGTPGTADTAPTDASQAPKAPPVAGRTPQQQQAVTKFNDYKAQPGSATNPVVPVNEAQYNKLAPGTHYIHADGSVRVKGG